MASELTESKEQTSNWLTPCINVLAGVKPKSWNSSIYRVPNKLREADEYAYIPRLVSIGPFHADKQDLKAMEEHKWRYAVSLVHRSTEPRACIKKCGKAIEDCVKEIRELYAENIKITDDELLQLMLIDGCFILELFLRSRLQDRSPHTDLILQNAWMEPTIRHDLALLENQIPFVIIEKLFESVEASMEAYNVWREKFSSITELALHFFFPNLNFTDEIKQKCSQDCRHLLAILHSFYLPTPPLDTTSSNQLEGDLVPRGGRLFTWCTLKTIIFPQFSKFLSLVKKTLPCSRNKKTLPTTVAAKTWGFKKCATDLLKRGISFEASTEGYSLNKSFTDNGVIKIRQLCLDETDGSRLRNLIAFEQCSLRSKHQITSYVIVLKSLIQSSLDVQLLQDKGIITTYSVDPNEVLALFNGILKGVAPKDSYFCDLCDRVNNNEKSCWQRYKHATLWKVKCEINWAILKRDYFSSTWSIISFGAAVVIIIFTALQTVYALLSYYGHGKG